MLLFLGHQYWSYFDDKTPFQVPRLPWPAVYLLVYFLWNPEGMYHWLLMLFVLRHKIVLKNHPSPEQSLRVIWEALFWTIVLSLVQIKLFSIPITDCLLSTVGAKDQWYFQGNLPGFSKINSDLKSWLCTSLPRYVFREGMLCCSLKSAKVGAFTPQKSANAIISLPHSAFSSGLLNIHQHTSLCSKIRKRHFKTWPSHMISKVG